MEQLLAQIWSEVLRIPQVGINDNFFDLGGHSLLATQVVAQVREMLQLELPLRLGDDRHRPGTAAGAARWALDRSVDAVRARFGRESVGYAAVVFSDVSVVPEEFRELAEKLTE